MHRTLSSSVSSLLQRWMQVELEPNLRRPWLNFARVRNLICYIQQFHGTLPDW